MKHGQRLTGYPALVDDADSVSIALLDTRDAADAATRAGVVRLLRIALKPNLAGLREGRRGFAQAAMQLKTTIPTDRLLADVLAAICDRAFIGDDPLPRSEKAFAEQTRRARTRLPAVAEGAFRLLAAIAAAHHALGQKIGAAPRIVRRASSVKCGGAGTRSCYPGFFAATPWAQLAHLPRYLTALDHRLAKYPENPERDARHSAVVETWWERYRERRDANRAAAAGRRGGAREFPLVARGARRFAVRTGVQDAVPGLRQAAGKGVGGTLSLTIGAALRIVAPIAFVLEYRNLLLHKGYFHRPHADAPVQTPPRCRNLTFRSGFAAKRRIRLIVQAEIDDHGAWTRPRCVALRMRLTAKRPSRDRPRPYPRTLDSVH